MVAEYIVHLSIGQQPGRRRAAASCNSGVPWAGIVATSVVFVFGAVLNALVPHVYEIALEAAALGVVFTWHDLPVPAPAAHALQPRGGPEEADR
jgi:L-asparagine transporter-like permease